MSWINWYHGVSDFNWLLARMFEEDKILTETWHRQHTTKEEAEYIPPDYDELVDFDGPVFYTESEVQLGEIFKQEKAIQRKERTIKKVRIPVSKKVKISLIRERGGLCECCKENAFHQIHHVDKDPSNNHPSNLLLVCYECHKELDKQ